MLPKDAPVLERYNSHPIASGQCGVEEIILSIKLVCSHLKIRKEEKCSHCHLSPVSHLLSHCPSLEKKRIEGIDLQGCTPSSHLISPEMAVQHSWHLVEGHQLAQQRLSLCFAWCQEFPKSYPKNTQRKLL